MSSTVSAAGRPSESLPSSETVSEGTKRELPLVIVGLDARKPYVSMACAHSISRIAPSRRVHFLDTEALRRAGVYLRAKDVRGNQAFDVIDGKPFSTDFSFSRFLVPALFERQPQWAVFCDDDFMWRESVDGLLPLLDDKYAVMVVKHDFQPLPGMKMDGQMQLPYRRKNWSSMILWNLGHPSNGKLTTGMVNTAPGSYLHGFDWLRDEEIGALPEKWNWLEGHSDPEIEPAAVHYTRGGPWLTQYRKAAYAEEWLALHFSSLNAIAKEAQTPKPRVAFMGW